MIEVDQIPKTLFCLYEQFKNIWGSRPRVVAHGGIMKKGWFFYRFCNR